MHNERTKSLTLNCEQAYEIRIALEERIKQLRKLQERCWELEIACENPLFKREYKKMGKTYQEWIDDVSAVLEHVKTETGEIKL